MEKIVLVGYGNMAKAMAKGLDSAYQIQICGRDKNKAKDFIKVNNLKNASLDSSLESGLDSSIIDIQDKIVILAIKPYALASFTYQGKAKAFYSVLAGVNIKTIKSHIKAESYIRLMPNIGAIFGLSSTAVFIDNPKFRDSQKSLESKRLKSTQTDSTDFVESTQSTQANLMQFEQAKIQAKQIIESFGNAVFVDNENLIDSAIATSGSSPAFLALIAQALIDAGVREGFKRTDSAILVQKTFEGVAKLLEQNSPDEIISLVTTPAGTTIEGLSILESKAIKGAIIKACHASVQKAKKATKANET